MEESDHPVWVNAIDSSQRRGWEPGVVDSVLPHPEIPGVDNIVVCIKNDDGVDVLARTIKGRGSDPIPTSMHGDPKFNLRNYIVTRDDRLGNLPAELMKQWGGYK